MSWHDDEECAGRTCWCADDVCICGHGLTRHDMGHGCIECRCRRFVESAESLAATRERTLT